MPIEKRQNNAGARGVIIVLIVMTLLYFGRALFVPLALSILLCFVLAPLVDRLERLGLGRIFSVVSVSSIVSILLASFVWLIASQVLEFSGRFSEYKSHLISRIHQIQNSNSAPIAHAGRAISAIHDEIAGPDASAEAQLVAPNLQKNSEESGAIEVAVVSMPTAPLQNVANWLGPTLNPLATTGVIFMLTIFILLERKDFRGRLVQLLASSNLAVASQAINEATIGIAKWLRTMFLINAIYGCVIATGVYFVGLPNVVLWGVFAFMCRFLPIVGPWIAGIFPLMLSLAIFDGWGEPIALMALFVVIELVVNTILEPWLYGKSIGLSPLGVVLAVVLWAWMWGPAGIILAIPITLVLVVLGRHLPQMNFFAVLFGDLSDMPGYHSLYQRLLSFNGEEATAIFDKQLQNHSLSKTFEQVLIPLLHRTELDRRAGAISDEQVEFILDAIDNAIENAPALSPVAGEIITNETQSEDEVEDAARYERTVLVVPISTKADEIGAKVLTKTAAHLPMVRLTVVSTSLLASEIFDRVSQDDFDAVFVTGLSPFTSAKARLIVKRIRQSFPDLPVISGLWKAAHDQNSSKPIVGQTAQVFERVDDAVNAINDIPRRLRTSISTQHDRNGSEVSEKSSCNRDVAMVDRNGLIAP